MEDKSKIIDIIKKCLALGDKSKNPNENEVANALAAAKRLMDEHNLSMADVAATQEKDKKEIIEHEMEERAGAPRWEYDLPCVCTNLFGTKSYVSVGYPSYNRRVVFVGYPQDVALSSEVYKLLWLELMNMGREWAYENPAPELTRKQQLVRKFKYLEGVVDQLRVRSVSNYQGFAPKDSKALQVMDANKKKDIEEWLKRHKNLTTSHRRDTGLHDDAKEEGWNDGKKVGLNFKSTIKEGNVGKPLQIGHKGGKS